MIGKQEFITRLEAIGFQQYKASYHSEDDPDMVIRLKHPNCGFYPVHIVFADRYEGLAVPRSDTLVIDYHEEISDVHRLVPAYLSFSEPAVRDGFLEFDIESQHGTMSMKIPFITKEDVYERYNADCNKS